MIAAIEMLAAGDLKIIVDSVHSIRRWFESFRETVGRKSEWESGH